MVKYRYDADFVKEALECGVVADSEAAEKQMKQGNIVEARALNTLSSYKRTLLKELFTDEIGK